MSAEFDLSKEGDARVAPRDRYLGGRPFADTPEDQALFFGRSGEIESLFNRILSGHLLILFGKSGLGKTSLLRAGVFPRLREHAYLPIEVRVGQSAIKRDEGRPQALESTFRDMVAAAAQDVAKHDTSLDYTPGEGETLWEFLKTAMFWRRDELQTPVLVLDQFEEIFTLLEARQRHEIAEAIGTACGLMPESVRSRRAQRAGATLSEEPPRLKFVISLREEYFGTLEQLSRDIPKIFLDRFQLMPLSEKQARDAVIMPATLPAFDPKSNAAGTFGVHPFTYREDALADMLAVLEAGDDLLHVATHDLELERLDGSRFAFEGAATEPVVVTAKEIGGRAGIQKVIENYYLEQIGKLPRQQRRLARTLCEEGLLTDSGYRLMLEESQIKKDYGLNTEVLGGLVDSRLLRQEQRLDSQFYELSHDSLAKAILAVRPRLRLPRHTSTSRAPSSPPPSPRSTLAWPSGCRASVDVGGDHEVALRGEEFGPRSRHPQRGVDIELLLDDPDAGRRGGSSGGGLDLDGDGIEGVGDGLGGQHGRVDVGAVGDAGLQGEAGSWGSALRATERSLSTGVRTHVGLNLERMA
jgi:hypothetical protein